MEEKLISIYNALNQLTVQGNKNCSIVGAIASTIEQMIKDLQNNGGDIENVNNGSSK